MQKFFIFVLSVFFQLSAVSAESALKGSITVDGSSTVYPISEAMAEEFQKLHPSVRVGVAQSGTGGGFKKFCAGEIDISDASRPIKDSEIEACAKNKISFIELPVGYDGIAVVTNLKNTWARSMTVAELKKIWEPGSTVKLWSDVRAEWPKEKIKLYGPGADSGTFDYFTAAVMGKEKSSRADYTSSENDNVLVTGVEGDQYSLGYFGYAYYEENKSKLNIVGIDQGKGAVLPSAPSIKSGSYAPLSRPIFIYVSEKSAAKNSPVEAFVHFYLNSADRFVTDVGYVSIGVAQYQKILAHFEARMTGTLFQKHGSNVGLSLDEILKQMNTVSAESKPSKAVAPQKK